MIKEKVMVGMSGGIDSSVTAYLLQQQGYEVEGIYLKLHNRSDGYHESNLGYIDGVAKFLGIKYHILDLSQKFSEEVYDYFVNSYLEGTTPNPCVKCNRNIKFGAMLDFAKEHQASYLATGHYAKTDGKFFYEASDKSKDQSYFLSQINKEALPFMMFPLSNFKKEDIINLGANLDVAYKKITEKNESQEICFVETVYTDVIKKHANIDVEGDVLDENGNVVGKHKGYAHYTIGKRKGFSVKGAHDPHFVTKINPKDNTIIVGKKRSLEINKVIGNQLNMYIDDKKFSCVVKLRYRSNTTPCDIEIIDDEVIIKLKEPAFGVASGQLAVFYDGNKVIGSAFIKSAK
ncbi:tRNA 2-thiouridine(34) synthase MnmA [Aliarcobacter cryaerophilus ATCC 43158]|uniref:tRNA-specific 2-thiouridylase MnmA n=1 Tax=Aliarcobacter cryaerophilus ATCC 43158 TaxID=1032070 RepID=A0AAD0TUA4_9BACT|nr:tRNA 2-thiouridine(34) synthase MnmA [Aliarcobacter cryaerophilus]AYJ80609.1 tRNA U34 2-thiouridylase [Aliarcobacter cryaerophilus ATCC 43158]PRM99308.1 tRNA 2-thiouridine(34) synthase MnmA [Aliarcobacter cryaerophilus]QCZ22943.1 tRNA 2-thiouridine(34) synthase MnmA [Aliarcobacter cryaerophilus ATCC 43158]